VATKNELPKTLSAILKEASTYSNACRVVKYTPSATVTIRLCLVVCRFPDIKAWCAHVTVIPEDNKTIVFNRGT